MNVTTILQQTAQLIVRRAAINDDFSLQGFRPALCAAVEEWEATLKENLIKEGRDDDFAAAYAEEFDKQIWPKVFLALSAVERGEVDIKIPIGAWKRESVTIGLDFGKKLLMRGAMPEKEGRRFCNDLKKAVRKRAKELLDGWPLSREAREAATKIMVAAAEDAVVSVVEHVSPFASPTLN